MMTMTMMMMTMTMMMMMDDLGDYWDEVEGSGYGPTSPSS